MVLQKQSEIWKDIVGYEGYYKISNLGNIKSLGIYHPSKRKGTIAAILYEKYGISKRKEKILKSVLSSKGYWIISLSKNGKKKMKFIHRLLAKAFIPNPENKPQINHIDNNSTNNAIENLEWCTAKENTQHSYRFGKHALRKKVYETRQCRHCNCSFIINVLSSQRYCSRSCGQSARLKESYRAMAISKMKKVVQLNLRGEKIKIWDSINDAAAFVKTTNCQISNAVNGRQKTCRGYKWKLINQITHD